ncbi:MAG: DUF4384 domain-containing protein, partial [Verrucomicrobiales bacterium]|nr:DUF4384 domain-containing protein [Verrucomicrobiales bacterium]
PTDFISWEETTWKLYRPGGISLELGPVLIPAAIPNSVLAGQTAPLAQLFIHYPAGAELAAKFKLGRGTSNSAIEVVPSPELANYFLVGRRGQTALEYAWILNRVFQENGSNMAMAAAARTKQSFAIPSALPLRTRWRSAGQGGDTAALVAGLEDDAQRLGMIRAWLQIEAPPNDSYFPYKLALKKEGSDATIDTGVELTESRPGKDWYGLVLQAENPNPRRFVQSRFIYVFAIDSQGQRVLLYPSGTGSVENRFPKPEQATAPPREIPLGPPRLFQIVPPFGVDTFIMLASEEQVPDPSIFESEGVRGGDPRRPTPLSRLLRRVGSSTRASQTAAPSPTNWSIDRVVVRSVPLEK